MGVILRRLNGAYTAALVPPVMALVGGVPQAMQVIHKTFTERYPGIPLSAFRATSANVLSEVGLGVVLLDNRLTINFRADQIMVQAENLRSREEIKFGVDCILLANNSLKRFAPEVTFGIIRINILKWVSVEGGRKRVEKALKDAAQLARSGLKKTLLGSSDISYHPKVLVFNDDEGWRLTATAELSAPEDADLFLYRHYLFEPGKKYQDFEQQFAFMQSTNGSISNWLGISLVD